MSITHNRRGRHWPAARNLTIAVATAALAGSGAAMAADGGTAPPTTKAPPDGAARQAIKAPPGGAGSGKPAPKTGDPGPLAENEPVVTQARAGLGRLVADGTIEQAEADVVLRSVIAGSVDPEALVRAGDVSAAHMPAIDHLLGEVKRANATPGG